MSAMVTDSAKCFSQEIFGERAERPDIVIAQVDGCIQKLPSPVLSYLTGFQRRPAIKKKSRDWFRPVDGVIFQCVPGRKTRNRAAGPPSLLSIFAFRVSRFALQQCNLLLVAKSAFNSMQGAAVKPAVLLGSRRTQYRLVNPGQSQHSQ